MREVSTRIYTVKHTGVEGSSTKYLYFFSYLIRHKWYVFLECCRYGVPWRGLIHDISKFLPGEFIPYANYYYGSQSNGDMNPTETGEPTYAVAWLIHQKRNRHHWQWWILYGEDDNPKVIPMPEKYIKEMVADWRGAGQAQGQSDTLAWYQANKSKIILHPSTRTKVEQLLLNRKIIDREYYRGSAVVDSGPFHMVETLN